MGSTTTSARQRELGSFYTRGNPFVYEPFRAWFAGLPAGGVIAEPFAGTGQIPRLVAQAGLDAQWALFDIDTSLSGVEHRDSIADYPQRFPAVITNPPYLSYHFAKRKGLAVDKAAWRGHPSLYLTCIELALAAHDHVAMIVPESFLTSGRFHDRLVAVVSLPFAMFDDTDMPTCLALWDKAATNDFQVWRQDVLLGTFGDLSRGLDPTPCAARLTFNAVDGQVGLKAIDSTTGATIGFCDPALIPAGKVKPSARLVSRIRVDGLSASDAVAVIGAANTVLAGLRDRTQDVLLTAFKGVRSDGRFRRRLDFANARAVLSHAVCRVEGHRHDMRASAGSDAVAA